jgi:hypothetical protein
MNQSLNICWLGIMFSTICYVYLSELLLIVVVTLLNNVLSYDAGSCHSDYVTRSCLSTLKCFNEL